MIRHRRLRLLGLALAVAASGAIAPATAHAEERRGSHYERRDHDRDHDRDRDRHERGDRWDRERDHRRDDRRSDRDRFERRGPPRAFAYDGRYRYRPAPPRYARPLPYRFYPHARVAASWPFYCSEHHHGFHDRRGFDEHLVHFHHLPYWQLPRLVAHVGFGWTFGY